MHTHSISFLDNIPADRPEIDLRNCRRSGHSYRKLPKNVRGSCIHFKEI
jgi:histone deacetylase complex regulatory component SIN3